MVHLGTISLVIYQYIIGKRKVPEIGVANLLNRETRTETLRVFMSINPVCDVKLRMSVMRHTKLTSSVFI